MARDRPPSPCPKCEAPVLWWQNANRPDRKVGVDMSPDWDTGTVQKIVSGTPDAPTVFGKVLSGRELDDAVSASTMLFTLHSKTCSANKPFNPKPAGLQLVLPAKKNQPRR